jgi:molybdopterin converting factor small subunit
MHKVRILFFATLRDYVGSKSLELEIPLGMKVNNSIMAAINREYVSGVQVIPTGAEIAFFPPVSGG